jgi:hypothetical protein
MAFVKSRGAGSITHLQKKLKKLSQLPATLDAELQLLSMEMADTAINMAPTYTNKLREAIKYRRIGGERNAKGQFVKGGIGIHIVELTHSQDYFTKVHETMSVGRKGAKYQPSERSVAIAADAGEIAGGKFMTRALQKYEPIIVQRLGGSADSFIRTLF